ncbi:rod shape-determining protein MreC [Clostridium hydrogeniformans]|uniref:rod shape-determining protein MreC n=1 Tax=Clostridium hydrogeniformans TaxID=349933 RepID=UPI000485C005|nr:rod shape-determining protein MreC [Clostridium hydrogeniformans]
MKFFKNKLAVTVVVLSVSFLGIIIFTVKRDNKSIIESGVGTALNPIQKVAYTISDKFKGALEFATNFSKVKKENDDLVKKNDELENKLVEFNGLKRENEELKETLKFTEERDNYNYVKTNIIGKAGNSFLDGYIVDKGTNDGLAIGMVAVTSKGLVGQVTSVASNWSIVQSLANENISVAAMVESTQDSDGVVKGYKSSSNSILAKVYHLPVDSEIKEDDVILTSGLGEIYPKNLRIGKVISVEEDKGKVMKIATIEPYVNFNKLQDMLIVVPKNKREIKY